jgi:GR25 family glycosyltransferase involved in LPS biosynthesis
MPFTNKAFVLLACILLHSMARADFVDHLKKCPEKTGVHSMDGIDFIYMINLDRRPEKFARSAKLLGNYGIYPYRFSAVNGWELSLEAINDVGVKYRPGMTSLFATSYPLEAEGAASNGFMQEGARAYFGHSIAKGTIGIYLSHLSILKDAWDSGYETIWIMEDDVEILKNPHSLSTLIHQLDALVGRQNWDVLFTDPNTKGANGKYVPAYGAGKRPDMDCSREARYSKQYTTETQISPDFRKISARFGAYSMIIRRSGIKKILDFSLRHHIFLPYDMEYYLPQGIQLYSLTYDVVSTLAGAPSDNGKPGYILVTP